MKRDKFCPLTEAKCVEENCVCYRILQELVGKEWNKRPYCAYFRVYLDRAEE